MQVVVKREPIELDDANHTPLKDYSKRKRNDAHVASPVISEQSAYSQPNKRMKFDVSTPSRSAKDTELEEGTENNQQDGEDDDEVSNEAGKSSRIPNKNKKNKKFASNKTAQSSETPVRFDYSQVDFKKFKGGSQKNKSNNEVQTKFHGKVDEIILNECLIIFNYFIFRIRTSGEPIKSSTNCSRSAKLAKNNL